MKVKEIMEKNVKFIRPDATLKNAAECMRQNDCGYLPVGEKSNILGSITDRDIVVRGIASECNPSEALVKDIMTEEVHYCFEDDAIEAAGDRMKTKQIRRLVVMNAEKEVTGVISLGDIAGQYKDNSLTGDIMRNVVE